MEQEFVLVYLVEMFICFEKRANNRMQVTPRAADYDEGRLAWARLLGPFRVSRAPDAEALARRNTVSSSTYF